MVDLGTAELTIEMVQASQLGMKAVGRPRSRSHRVGTGLQRWASVRRSRCNRREQGYVWSRNCSSRSFRNHRHLGLVVALLLLSDGVDHGTRSSRQRDPGEGRKEVEAIRAETRPTSRRILKTHRPAPPGSRCRQTRKQTGRTHIVNQEASAANLVVKRQS
jgi:hypothetical protein